MCFFYCVKIEPMSKRNLYPRDYVDSTYSIDFKQLYFIYNGSCIDKDIEINKLISS